MQGFLEAGHCFLARIQLVAKRFVMKSNMIFFHKPSNYISFLCLFIPAFTFKTSHHRRIVKMTATLKIQFLPVQPREAPKISKDNQVTAPVRLTNKIKSSRPSLTPYMIFLLQSIRKKLVQSISGEKFKSIYSSSGKITCWRK